MTPIRSKLETATEKLREGLDLARRLSESTGAKEAGRMVKVLESIEASLSTAAEESGWVVEKVAERIGRRSEPVKAVASRELFAEGEE